MQLIFWIQLSWWSSIAATCSVQLPGLGVVLVGSSLSPSTGSRRGHPRWLSLSTSAGHQHGHPRRLSLSLPAGHQGVQSSGRVPVLPFLGFPVMRVMVVVVVFICLPAWTICGGYCHVSGLPDSDDPPESTSQNVQPDNVIPTCIQPSNQICSRSPEF